MTRALAAFAALVAALLLWLALGPFQTLWDEASTDKTRLVAALFSFLGTLFTALIGLFLFHLQQRARADEQDRARADEAAKAEADALALRRKLASALRAEIAESLVRLRGQFSTPAILAQLARDGATLDAGDSAHALPVGVAFKSNAVYDTHQKQLYELPEPLVRASVRYYQNDLHMNEYLAALSTGLFSGITLERQKMAVVFYRDLGQDTLRAGLRAKALLDCYIAMQNADAVPAGLEKGRMEAILAGDAEDARLAEILPEDDAQLLRGLPGDNATDHIAEFRAAIGLSRK